MEKITVAATKKSLDKILDISHKLLSENKCDSKTILNLDLVIEEVFVNVVNYAYSDKKDGKIKVRCEVQENPRTFFLEIIDKGVKFNPLVKKEPNIKLKAEDRKIGGLGIFLAKKLTDKIDYFYKNNENHLSFEKKF